MHPVIRHPVIAGLPQGFFAQREGLPAIFPHDQLHQLPPAVLFKGRQARAAVRGKHSGALPIVKDRRARLQPPARQVRIAEGFFQLLRRFALEQRHARCGDARQVLAHMAAHAGHMKGRFFGGQAVFGQRFIP